MAAMLTSVMDDSQKVPFYIDLCRRMKLKILPPDINASHGTFSVDKGAIRFGLAAVKNVGEGAIANVVAERERGGPFTSLTDFCSRVDAKMLNKRVLESLIKCGAFDSLGARRSQLLSILDRAISEANSAQKDKLSGQIGLFAEEGAGIMEIPLPEMEEVPESERLNWEKEITGFYITGHPLNRFARKLNNLPSIQSLKEGAARDKQVVRIGGLLAEAKRHTTKRGDTMCFAVLEDFSEKMEVTVFARTFYQYVNLLLPDAPVVVQGRLDIDEDKVSVLADKFWPLEEYVPEYYLILPAGEAYGAAREGLNKILAEHPGEDLVHVQVGGRWQTLPEGQGLADDDGTRAALIALLGEKAVKKR